LGIDISEKRRQQDGRILYDFCGNPLDIRVATYGTIYGKMIVMRLLNNRDRLLNLKESGMAPTVAGRYIEDAVGERRDSAVITVCVLAGSWPLVRAGVFFTSGGLC
jgi:type II secretory ATPase GspE/PulE/Tfp pilus assembly ATPase PilB-like protein